MGEKPVTDPAVSLTEIIGACTWCLYRKEINASGDVSAAGLNDITTDYADLEDQICDSVRDGKCKVALYAIEQQFDQNQEV